ncbi:hypothetical protein GPECTOR_32g452 [Gonium pectorale]|uniref:Uncharacterized protein n=1 Tax=Gonium pectorale TaxID=33097 RepID=A0A150GES0_GONPE|nr:hypothetical protein GPECTOR_32g452 [Gonium pectorale]|eukprot:KXZ47840.1 hypothetical protein GPECTOR_32g452 [Gonium pectorale]
MALIRRVSLPLLFAAAALLLAALLFVAASANNGPDVGGAARALLQSCLPPGSSCGPSGYYQLPCCNGPQVICVGDGGDYTCREPYGAKRANCDAAS